MTKRLVDERYNDLVGYSAWAVSRDLSAAWYRVDYWIKGVSSYREFYDSEGLFNWLEKFETKHNLSDNGRN